MASADLHDRIQRRAYALWEQEGRPDGRAAEHWLRAEAEVAGVHSGDQTPPGTGAGEHVCPECVGRGRVKGRKCKACGGTGRIIIAPQPWGTRAVTGWRDRGVTGLPLADATSIGAGLGRSSNRGLGHR